MPRESARLQEERHEENDEDGARDATASRRRPASAAKEPKTETTRNEACIGRNAATVDFQMSDGYRSPEER